MSNKAQAQLDLLQAAKDGTKSDISAALAGGAAVSGKDPETGRTALHHAAELSRLDILQKLLQSGADPLVTDNDGHTPLYYAAKENHLDVVKRLLIWKLPPAEELDAASRAAANKGHMRVFAQVARSLSVADKSKATTMLEQLQQDPQIGPQIATTILDAWITDVKDVEGRQKELQERKAELEAHQSQVQQLILRVAAMARKQPLQHDQQGAS